jgi:TetR/AcrR family transcriptional repressor of nem operon
MRYDEAHKQKTREKVLQAAAQAIRAEGPDRVGVAGIMARAGLTHGGFYAHFESKEDLVAEAIEQMFVEGRQRFAAIVAGKPPAQALGDYLDFYLSKAHRDAPDAGCAMAALCTDLPRLSDRAKATFGNGYAGLIVWIRKQLEDMGHGEAKMTASSVVSEMVGAVALARSIPDRDRSDALLESSRKAIRRRLGLDA